MRASIRTLVCLGYACTAGLCGALEQPSGSDGYQVVRHLADPALHREWVLLKDTLHPGAPARIFETAEPGERMRNAAGSDSTLLETRTRDRNAPPVVRAGDSVTISRQQGSATLELTGTSLTSAGLGECASLRTEVAKGEVYGVVRGPGRVELATKLMCSRRSVP